VDLPVPFSLGESACAARRGFGCLPDPCSFLPLCYACRAQRPPPTKQAVDVTWPPRGRGGSGIMDHVDAAAVQSSTTRLPPSRTGRQAGRQRGDAAEFADISGKHKVMFSGFMCIKIKCIEIVRDCRKTSKKTAKNKVTLYIHSFIPHQSHQLRSKHKTYPTYCFSFSGTLKMNPFLVFPKLAAAKEPQDDPFRVCALHSAAQDESRASREAESGLYQGMGSWYASTAVDELDRCWPTTGSSDTR